MRAACCSAFSRLLMPAGSMSCWTNRAGQPVRRGGDPREQPERQVGIGDDAPGDRHHGVVQLGPRLGQLGVAFLVQAGQAACCSTGCWRVRAYGRTAAYGHSKLANLQFTYELQRRLGDSTTIAVAAHPGGADTVGSRAAMFWSSAPTRATFPLVHPFLPQSPAMGAAAGPARRDGPGRPGRRVLRAARPPAEQGVPEAGPVERAILRRGAPAAAVDALGGADRRQLRRPSLGRPSARSAICVSSTSFAPPAIV